MTARAKDLEASTFQKRPAYRYIRESDHVPVEAPDDGTAVALVKLFAPDGGWRWYIAAYDPLTRTAYGLVHGQEDEYGYFFMEELVAFRGRFGLPIERDLYWKPRPLSECLV
ncbi:MAG: DUF2958 domain-containing protein [Dehalococcoidia bacterium]|nr:DUF2958 domain-containing protein [Dehalococcoidia bacterium]